MNVFESRYYKVTKFLAILVGIWPYDCSRMKPIRRMFIHLYSVCSVILFSWKFVMLDFNVDVFCTSLSLICVVLICWVKYITCLLNGHYILEFMEHIKNDWNALGNNDDRKILEKYAEECRTLNLIYAGVVSAGVTVSIIIGFLPSILDIIIPLNESRRPNIPYFGKCMDFIDEEKYYVPLALYWAGSLTILLTVLTASDSVFISIIYHLCAIVIIVGFTKEVIACYDVSYTIQVLITVVALTIIILRIFWNLREMEKLGDLVIGILHIIGYTVLVFLNMVATQRVLDCSRHIFYKTYFSRWYDVPLNIQKLLLFIMQNTTEPAPIVIANMIEMNYKFYGDVLRTCLSYFTVLHSVLD